MKKRVAQITVIFTHFIYIHTYIYIYIYIYLYGKPRKFCWLRKCNILKE